MLDNRDTSDRMGDKTTGKDTVRGDQAGQSGRAGGQGGAQSPLRDTGEGLLGDTNEDRNLTGSTTYRTLSDQGPETEEQSRTEQQPPASQSSRRGGGSS